MAVSKPKYAVKLTEQQYKELKHLSRCHMAPGWKFSVPVFWRWPMNVQIVAIITLPKKSAAQWVLSKNGGGDGKRYLSLKVCRDRALPKNFLPSSVHRSQHWLAQIPITIENLGNAGLARSFPRQPLKKM